MLRRVLSALAVGVCVAAAAPAWAQEGAEHAPEAIAPAQPGALAPAEAAAQSHEGAQVADSGDDEASDADGPGLGAEDAAELERASNDPKLFAGVLRAQLERVRPQVLTKMDEKLDAKAEKRLAKFRNRMGLFSLAGLLLLFAPLLLMKKYPGRFGVLMKYSALAAVSFIVCVNLFTGVAALMKGAQSTTGKFTNPQIAITTAAFDSLHDNAEEVVQVGIDVIEPTMNEMERGETQDPLPSAFMGNIAHAAESVATPAAIATVLSVRRLVKRVDWAFGYYPIVMTVYGLLIFVLGMKPMLKEIVELPAKAASDPAAARESLRRVFASIGREFLSTLCLVFALVAVTLLAGAFLGLAMRPAVDVFLGYLLASFMYIKTVHAASGAVLLVSLSSTVIFLILNFAVIMVATGLFMGKVKTIFKDKFQKGVPLNKHASFLGWGTFALLFALALPALFARVADPLVQGPIEHAFVRGGAMNWNGFLVTGPVVMVLGFVMAFWLARGAHVLFFLKVYKRTAFADVAPPPSAAWMPASRTLASQPPAEPAAVAPPLPPVPVVAASRLAPLNLAVTKRSETAPPPSPSRPPRPPLPPVAPPPLASMRATLRGQHVYAPPSAARDSGPTPMAAPPPVPSAPAWNQPMPASAAVALGARPSQPAAGPASRRVSAPPPPPPVPHRPPVRERAPRPAIPPAPPTLVAGTPRMPRPLGPLPPPRLPALPVRTIAPGSYGASAQAMAQAHPLPAPRPDSSAVTGYPSDRPAGPPSKPPFVR